MRSETEKMLSEGLYSGSAWKECAERLAGMALPDDERLAFACLRFACGERDALAPEVAGAERAVPAERGRRLAVCVETAYCRLSCNGGSFPPPGKRRFPAG